jgi:hypothetical protein
MAAIDWAQANQCWLAGRFAQLKARVSAANPDDLHLDDDTTANGFEPAHTRLVRLFGLSRFEGDLLLLAAGLECDSPLRQAIAEAQAVPDDAALRLSFALALRVLPEAHWDALSPLAPLRHWPLVQLDGGSGMAHARLRVEERVLHHLTGVADFDERLNGAARLIDPSSGSSTGNPRGVDAYLAERIAQALAAHPRPLVMLGCSPHVPGQRALARNQALAAIHAMRFKALWVDASALDSDARAAHATALAIDREAALNAAVVVIAGAVDGSDAGQSLVRLIAPLRSPVLLLGNLQGSELADLPERRCTRFSLPAAAAMGSQLVVSPVDPRHDAFKRAAQQFHVDADTCDQALAAVGGGDKTKLEERLWQALREAARGGLDSLAQRVDAPTRLADLVLPANALETLKEMATQLRHRAQVHEAWGFATTGGRGLGLAALFAGDSGTGKTYAAEAVANEAGLDLYRIDLALTVSKYIGETEKNLRKLFDAAEASGAVLLFDEADALFGKRSDVKDSHDRYANIEVAYLLQRIESYRGLAILTTNLKSSLDRAFLRRLRFVVNFPFPDEAAREKLWRRQFPAQAPLAADIDWPALTRLHLTGGHIRAVALNAAFRAAADGGAITQRNLIDAARAEYAKLERSFGVAGASP